MAITMAVLCLCAAIVGGAVGARLMARRPVDRVVTRQLIILDEHSRGRAALGTAAGGVVAFTLMSSAGRPRISLTAASGDGGDASLTVIDEYGQGRGIFVCSREAGTGMVLQDAEGKARAAVIVTTDGAAHVHPILQPDCGKCITGFVSGMQP